MSLLPIKAGHDVIARLPAFTFTLALTGTFPPDAGFSNTPHNNNQCGAT
jgi:hypothetical protein